MKIGTYNLNEARKIAMGTARSILRGYGDNPRAVAADEALAVLDDLGRNEPDSIAAMWYRQSSDNQIRTFEAEWSKWQKGN